MRIGLISDTHGRLREEVFGLFEGVERIIHAGDIGPVDLLVELEAIAPVTAVYGNTDRFDVRERVPRQATLDAGGMQIAIMHGDQLGSPTPAALREVNPGADIIVYGHTHKPLVDQGAGTSALVVNPGSAGAARFGIPPSVGILMLDGKPEVRLIELGR